MKSSLLNGVQGRALTWESEKDLRRRLPQVRSFVRAPYQAQRKVYKFPGLDSEATAKYAEVIGRFQIPEIQPNLYPFFNP